MDSNSFVAFHHLILIKIQTTHTHIKLEITDFTIGNACSSHLLAWQKDTIKCIVINTIRNTIQQMAVKLCSMHS